MLLVPVSYIWWFRSPGNSQCFFIFLPWSFFLHWSFFWKSSTLFLFKPKLIPWAPVQNIDQVDKALKVSCLLATSLEILVASINFFSHIGNQLVAILDPSSLVTNPPGNGTGNQVFYGLNQDGVRNQRKFKSPQPWDLAIIKRPFHWSISLVKSPGFSLPHPSRLTLIVVLNLNNFFSVQWGQLLWLPGIMAAN